MCVAIDALIREQEVVIRARRRCRVGNIVTSTGESTCHCVAVEEATLRQDDQALAVPAVPAMVPPGATGTAFTAVPVAEATGAHATPHRLLGGQSVDPTASAPSLHREVKDVLRGEAIDRRVV